MKRHFLIILFLLLLQAVPIFAATPVVDNFGHTSLTSAGTSLTIAKPTGITTGDTLIIIVMNDAANLGAQWDNVTNKPAGFTLINEVGNSDTDVHAAAFWKIADGIGEGDPITVTSADSALQEGWWLRVTGAHASAPLDVTGADVNITPAISIAITGVTTTVDSVLAFYVHATDGGDTAPVNVSGTGWTESAEDSQGSTQGLTASWGEKDQTSIGATGTATVTFTLSDGASGFQFGIAPAVATGAAPQRRRHMQ